MAATTRHTKENWMQLTGISNDEQDMEKQRIKKENQDKNIQDDNTTNFVIHIEMLDNVER